MRRGVEAEIKAMIGMSVALWVSERSRLIAKSGPGFLRWSGKDGARAMRTAAQRCLSAGVEWVDLERAVKRTAAVPQAGLAVRVSGRRAHRSGRAFPGCARGRATRRPWYSPA